MRETLWISLPEQQAVAVKKILKFIDESKLSSLSVNQFLHKLINNQANDWQKIFKKYNNITSVRNIDLSELLSKTLNLNNQFLYYEEELENKIFKPNELISLIILCYYNVHIIGGQLCEAIKNNNDKAIAKQILEKSSYDIDQRRVVPLLSNLCLLNYALYINDTSIQLPKTVRNRIRKGAIRKKITLLEIGQFTFINHTYWSNYPPPLPDTTTMQLERLQTDAPFGYLVSSTGTPSWTVNNGSRNHIHGKVASSLAFFYLVKNIPLISKVMSNIQKDIGNTLCYIRNFFSRPNILHSEQTEQKTMFFSPVN